MNTDEFTKQVQETGPTATAGRARGWRRRTRMLSRDLLLQFLRGAAYTLGGLLVAWLIYQVRQ